MVTKGNVRIAFELHNRTGNYSTGIPGNALDPATAKQEIDTHVRLPIRWSLITVEHARTCLLREEAV